jgi:hypothetical protein
VAPTEERIGVIILLTVGARYSAGVLVYAAKEETVMVAVATTASPSAM